MILQAAALSVLFCSVHSFTVQASAEKSEESSGNNIEDDDFSVSTLLEKANVNVGKNFDDPLVMFGDIAVPDGFENADPCTARGCLWPKATDGNVYVPYRISNQYSKLDTATDVIAENLGRNWRKLGRKLGLTDVKLESISRRHPTELDETVRELLKEWRKSRGAEARAEELIKALRACEFNLTADKVEDRLAGR